MRHKYDEQYEKQSIINSIKRIANILKKTPTQKEYKINKLKDELTLEQIFYRFSNYNNAVVAAGLTPNESQNPPRSPEITKEELIEEYIRVANKLGKIPANNEFRVHSKFSWTPYKTKWGSFKEAANFIKHNFRDRFQFVITDNSFIKNKLAKKSKLLGYLCNMIYEPTNEQETIALFVIISQKLGYKIKKIQSDFPDAVLIDKNGKETLTEFEYLSSNYRQHCHPEDFQGLVICWRKDIDLGNIKIFSIEEYIKG